MLVFAVIYAVIGSRIGLFLRALREDADAASAMGVDVVSLKVLVFSLTSPPGRAHGVDLLPHCAAPHAGDPGSPGDGVPRGLRGGGGLESPVAGAVAAIVLVVLLEVLRVITIGPFRFEPGVWRFALFGALLVVTLRIAPDGFIAPFVARLGRAGRQRSLMRATASATAGRAGGSAPAGGAASDRGATG